MTNMWSLAQMRQLGRSSHQDYFRATFVDFVDIRLDERNFKVHKEVEGVHRLVTKWSDCMSCEYERRKEAPRLCPEDSCGIQTALWAALENDEHRMMHWLQLISIANSGPSEDYSRKFAAMEKIQREIRGRSRSPHVRRGA